VGEHAGHVLHGGRDDMTHGQNTGGSG
jgi:hypothetical protein